MKKNSLDCFTYFKWTFLEQPYITPFLGFLTRLHLRFETFSFSWRILKLNQQNWRESKTAFWYSHSFPILSSQPRSRYSRGDPFDRWVKGRWCQGPSCQEQVVKTQWQSFLTTRRNRCWWTWLSWSFLSSLFPSSTRTARPIKYQKFLTGLNNIRFTFWFTFIILFCRSRLFLFLHSSSMSETLLYAHPL